MNVHIANIFWQVDKYKHFVSQRQKSEFQIHHLYKGGESTGCLVFQCELFVEDVAVDWVVDWIDL